VGGSLDRARPVSVEKDENRPMRLAGPLYYQA